MKNKKAFQLAYVLKNNSSPISSVIALDYANRFDLKDYTKVYHSFSDIVKLTEEAKYIKSMIDKMEKTAIGKAATHFSMKDTLGNMISTSNFAGKYLFVDFWASSCKPYRIDNKHLVKLYEKYNGHPFEILGVSFDEDKDSWIKAIQKDGLSWPQISELNGWKNTAKEIYDNPLPGSVLISPEGIIIGKNLKHDELAQKLAEVFNE